MTENVYNGIFMESKTPYINTTLTHAHLDTFTVDDVDAEKHDHPCQVRFIFRSNVGVGYPFIGETEAALKEELDTFLSNKIYKRSNESVAADILIHMQPWIKAYDTKTELSKRFNCVAHDLVGVEVIVDESADAELSQNYHINGIMTFTAYNREALKKYEQ